MTEHHSRPFQGSRSGSAHDGRGPDAILNQNLAGKVQNPLEGIPRHQLLRDVDNFAEEKGLVEHVVLLRKGALLAQLDDRADYETLVDDDGSPLLDDDEKTALYDEIHHKWRLPKRLYLTIITCSIGAAVQGWDQTGSNGANIFFPTVYGIGGKSAHDQLLVGLVNAGPYIGSAFLGCWLSDP